MHYYYGDELGLTTDDEDYIDPTVEDRDDNASNLEFVSAIDDSNYEEAIEISNFNIYQPLDSSSGNSLSNNNSGNNSATSGDYINSKIMKSNAKELTLISAKPEDTLTSNSQTQQTSSASASGSGSGSAVAVTKSTNVAKESKHNTSTFDSKRKIAKNTRQREENTNKNSEALPTDVSDSSDSEENNIP